MFKVTFSFEDGSVVEHFANAGDNLLGLAREANVAIERRAPEMLPAESAGYS